MSVVDAKPLAINSNPFAISLTLSPSLRGALATKQSILALPHYGLLRFARNDVFGHVSIIIIAAAVVAVAGSRPSFVAWRARWPRAAHRDRRCGWPESTPAPRRDRRSAHRTARDVLPRRRELHRS